MDKVCTVLVHHDKSQPPSASELRQRLEKGEDAAKIAALKQVIALLLNGEALPGVLMTIIRFVLPSRNHTIKKLLLIYLEVIDKVTADGKLRPEMILVCNALRNDLNHPNEYIRGSTCRFLCKIREAELLEPLIPSIRANLEHRHSYVRRNAALCIYQVYRLHESLVPDAPELILGFMASEADASCKRNGLIMLMNCAPDKAIEYLAGVLDSVEQCGDVLQLTVVELVRKLVRQNPALRGKYIRVIFGLLKSGSSAVRFEAAHTLIMLSSAPSAIRAAAACYIDLLCKESDNNVKLIVLDKLVDLKQRHTKVMAELLLDILRALASPSLDIRRKTLAIALDLVSLKNIDEVVQVLKKEIGKTQAKEFEKQGEYRQMLIQAIHSCAVKFPDVAQNVVHLMMDFLGDTNVASAVDVVMFVREVVETYPDLRASIVAKLLEAMDTIRSSKVFRAALWIVGEYSQTPAEVANAFNTIKACMGDPPFVDAAHADEADEAALDKEGERGGAPPSADKKRAAAGPKLNPDGTYATQSALMEEYSSAAANKAKEVPNLRALLLAGDFFLSTVIATTLAKLTLKMLQPDSTFDTPTRNRAHGEALLYMAAILRLGKSTTPPHPIDRDSYERITMCMRVLLERDAAVDRVFLAQCRQSFHHMLEAQSRLPAAAAAAGKAAGAGATASTTTTTTTTTTGANGDVGVDASRAPQLLLAASPAANTAAFPSLMGATAPTAPPAAAAAAAGSDAAAAAAAASGVLQADDCIKIRQLRTKRTYGHSDLEDEDEADLSRATGLAEKELQANESKLNRVVQLTGFSDPVFAEAYVTVHQYDIVLEVTMINQTADTLQNVCLELATLGDLKLVERPQYLTIAPCDKRQLKASIKVSSTETGIIFGNVVYDIAGAASDADRNCVILNDIHIDIMDYIAPATCSDVEFREFWSAFEWENKVAVQTNFTDVDLFLEHIVKSTNMRCLTPTTALSGQCGFVAANLYAKSIFGEHALANVSIAKDAKGAIIGAIRIRSKSQGVALSLGDKITLKMRG